MTVQVIPADHRFRTRIDWLDSFHSFNFGEHFHPERGGHGLLLVLNDDRVAPGTGFGTHGHRDMEIVTWVLEGRLEHQDSEGNHGELYPGLAQRMSAGRGIRHSEVNPSPDEPVHFLQMWVLPDTPGVEPGYAQRDVTAELASGELVAVASGRGHETAIPIRQRDAVMWAARPSDGATIVVPAAPRAYLFVARGAGELEGVGRLGVGDAAALTDDGERRFTSGADTEIVIWETA